MSKTVKTEEKNEDEELQEIIKKHRLKNIGFMVCGELQSMGDHLSRDHNTSARIGILIEGCLERLSLARTTIRFAQENEGKFDEYEIAGIETAVNECYAMLTAAMAFEDRRPLNADEVIKPMGKLNEKVEEIQKNKIR